MRVEQILKIPVFWEEYFMLYIISFIKVISS